MSQKVWDYLQKLVLVTLMLVLAASCGYLTRSRTHVWGQEKAEEIIDLPKPGKTGELSVEEAIAERRSIRNFAKKPLSIKEVSQLLWSAQGITEQGTGKRAAPSAGMTYPLELYLVVGSPGVEKLGRGVYHYRPEVHKLKRIVREGIQPQLSSAALGQSWVKEAPVDIVITGVYRRTTGKYGQRGIRYVHIEAGAAAENLYLQVETLGLGMVTVGAFRDKRVLDLLNLSDRYTPLLVIPVGYPEGS